MKKSLVYKLLPAVLFVTSFPAVAFAACDLSGVQGDTYQNPIAEALNVCSIPDFLLALVNLVFLIAIPLIVVFLIYSGFLFVTGGDNDAQLAKAKTTFTWTVIGALLLLGAKALSMAIQATILSLG